MSCLQCCDSQTWGAATLLDNAGNRFPILAPWPVWVFSHPKYCYDFGLPSSAGGAWQWSARSENEALKAGALRYEAEKSGVVCRVVGYIVYLSPYPIS